jgi:hypothetical protein
MPDFHRTYVNEESFIRGAARLLWAGSTVTFPTSISSVINMSLYDATASWNELGATKTGIQISVNNSEESFDVDQILGNIDTQPTGWEVSVQTALAEMTLERLQVAWEGYPVTTDTAPTSGSEKVVHFGQPTDYTERRLAVLFQRPNGKIRAYLFRKVNRAPQESTVNHNKTGEQISIPLRFNCLPDLSVAEARQRFFTIRDQI